MMGGSKVARKLTRNRAEQLGVSRALLATHFRGCGLDAPAQPAQVEWVLGQAPPRPVVVPRRCHAGASFGVVVGRDTPRAETVVPGANPCIEPLPPGTRVFDFQMPAIFSSSTVSSSMFAGM